MSFFDPERTLISDTECYKNFWSIGFKRVSDGKTVVMEHSRRQKLDTDRLTAILKKHLIVGYNWKNYDQVMVAAAVAGFDNAQLKQTNDRIIVGGMKYWDAESMLDIVIPRKWQHIDLIEPQPNAFASLKTLAGRMHARKLQDLPYEPDSFLTEEQMDAVLSYMGNDLDNTHLLFDNLRAPLELRAFLTKTYGVDVMSKSDAQIGETIIKTVAEKKTGRKIAKPQVKSGSSFRYNPPAFLSFTDPTLVAMFERIKTTDFYIQNTGKVELPDWITKTPITLGETTYAMGIGGLHSTESNRSVHADEDYGMVDADVTGFYPQIIIESGLYPPAVGPTFCDVYGGFKRERDEMKPLLKIKQKDPTVPKAEIEDLKSAVEARKLFGNGPFGKTSSPYSCLYAPPLMIYTTLTGQLSILMLVNMIRDAGADVVSANTDGVVIRYPREMVDGIDGDRFRGGYLKEVVEKWEKITGYNLEVVEYQSLYNLSVNSYMAVKPNGSIKIKGAGWTGRHDGDMRTQLMKNPSMEILALAVSELITKGTPLEDTIRGCTDVRDFVTVVNVKGGGTWNDEYLGKVVRYYWGKGGTEILYSVPHPTTGNYKRVSKSEGCRPLMELPDELPDDIDYERYIEAAEEVLMDIGYNDRAPPIKPLRLFKYNAIAYWGIAV